MGMVTRSREDLLKFFADHVALGRDDIAPDPTAYDLANALRNARLAIHKGVEVVGVQHQQTRPRDSGNRPRAPGPAQRRDLAEEMAGTKPNALALELDLHFARRDEVHRMCRVATPCDNHSGLDLLGAQQSHDVGDVAGMKLCE